MVRIHPAVPNNDEKKKQTLKDLPLGFIDRQEKELLVRDFIISNIKEVMIGMDLNILKHQVSIRKALENFYLIKIDQMEVSFHLKMRVNGYL